jgi:3-oxoadipate enol-lactonase|tara:strand:+ start:657 stop:1460 length:804 start_codon:yes stop_codon:yes gene_type:complete
MPTVVINGHDMYYEVHGEGPPAVYIGGWDTFCHGRSHYLTRGMTENYQTVIIDYRGIGESTDDLSMTPSTELFADDIAALLDHLNMKSVYFVGLVGMGACIGQWVALKRPDLVRCMVNMGCWTWADPMLADQLQAFGDMHEHAGFAAFQSMVAAYSFRPDYYNANRHKLLGSDGVWGNLEGRLPAHLRFIEACLGHDIRPHLSEIGAPTLVVHAAQDVITGPRTTTPLEEGLPNGQGVTMNQVAHVVAGKDEKIAFCKILFDFLGKY